MLALCGGALLVWATAATALSSQQSLASAAPELSKASAATRVAFVEAAVAELVAVHRAVARPSGKAGQGKKSERKAAAWSTGAQAYVGRLQGAAVAARAGAPVRLVVDRGSVLRVVIGQRPARQFIVAAPQAKGRPALERAILRRLCAVDGCGGPTLASAQGESPPAVSAMLAASLTAHHAVTPPKPMAAPTPRLVSSLSNADGLVCVQDEVRHHVLYDNACKAVLADVRALVKQLYAAARRGVVIDWRMPARPVAKGDKYELAVNGQGDTVSLSMPALGNAAELLVDILPWAQARLFGGFQTLALQPPSRLVYGAAVAQR